jgi:ribosomal protein S18 acetylase RimI-like enzyme
MQGVWRMLNEFTRIGDLCLRGVNSDDDLFLKQLFRLTRPHLTQIPMPPEFVEVIVQQQYDLQKSSYVRHFPGCGHFLIMRHQEPIGRLMLYLDVKQASLRLVDICLLPQWCGQGYGSALLWSLQSLAQKNKWQLLLSVDHQNWRAKKLYGSLGFQLERASTTHSVMVWSAVAYAD